MMLDTLAGQSYPSAVRFADLIAPMPVQRFMAEHHDRKPLHIINDAQPRRPLDWARFNRLLDLRSHWSEANLKLVMNSRPVLPDLYIDDPQPDQVSRRANPEKVNALLAVGASLVANDVQDISPEARAIAASVSAQFAGLASANIYCSFRGVQAFASHCDLHHVFVFQCEGEKVWNVYENRAAAPVQQLEGDDAQAMIDAAKGRILMQVRLRPGELLYIPRGFYHDALASSDASLHLTLGVAPLTGMALFRMIEAEASGDETFRHYLPDGRRDPEALKRRLQQLAERIGAMLSSDRMVAEMTNRQRTLVERDFGFSLPERSRPEFYARSNRPADLRVDPQGTWLKLPAGELRLLDLAPAAEWMIGRPAFSVQELCARFAFLSEKELRLLLRQLVDAGLFYPFEPRAQTRL